MQQDHYSFFVEVRQILPYFLKRYLPLVLLAVVVLVAYFSVDITHERRQVEVREQSRIALAQRTIESDIAGVVAELNYLAESGAVQGYCAKQGEESRAILVTELVNFARHFKRYQQLRWLDLQGQERVRIDYSDGRAVVVPKRQLQDKSQRYYFREAIALPPGGVYISPMDLNVEHGVVESPHRPMLRLATPTVNGEGERNGLLILNYEARGLLDHFAGLAERGVVTLQLLNNDGYWLYHPDQARTFAFMFGAEHSFAQEYAREWQEIVQRGRGQLRTAKGLFTFSALSMMEHARRYGSGSAPADRWQYAAELPRDVLLLVSHFGGEVDEQLLNEHEALYLPALLLLLGLSAVVVWRLARSHWEREQLMERLALHAKVMETASNGVVITDADKRIISVNRGFSELTGFTADEVMGQSPAMFASGRHDDDFYQTMWHELELNGRWEGEIWNRHKNGEVYPEWLCISAIKDQRGEVSHYIGLFSVLSEQKSTESRLRELANSDPLTGLVNRNLLYDRAAQAISQCRRNQCRAAFLFIDLDSFKPVNDRLGHAAGDMVLRQVASRLKECVRESDTVARFGGDEFVLLLQSVNSREAVEELAQKVLDTIAPDIIVAGEPCKVGASIGISLYPEDGDTIEAVLNAADQAMYRAKEAGRHRYLFATES